MPRPGGGPACGRLLRCVEERITGKLPRPEPPLPLARKDAVLVGLAGKQFVVGRVKVCLSVLSTSGRVVFSPVGSLHDYARRVGSSTGREAALSRQ